LHELGPKAQKAQAEAEEGLEGWNGYEAGNMWSFANFHPGNFFEAVTGITVTNYSD
jgi:hypothetical protein